MPARLVTCLAILFLVVPSALAQNNDETFGLAKVHEFHLQLTAREWERMQAIIPGMTLFAPKRPVAKEGEEPFEWHKTSGFGIEFPWAHADLHAGGKIYKNVGLRYKGNGSYVSTDKMLKRNLKIELDHYDDEQRFHGLKTITLNAGAVDASRMREALAYAVYRGAGVPAPRTAFVKVTLTVPGKHDKEFVGLYTFIEHVDKSFLKNHFKNGKGLLMKPERMRGIDYLGDDWEKYKKRYLPKREATAKEAQRVIEFAKLVNKAEDAEFAKQIGGYLDLDLFLRFTAVTTMLPNTDSFFTTGHNYFIYLNPKTDKLVFMPWDLDISFAGFPAMGSIDQQANQNLLRPVPGRFKLIDRLFALPEVKEKYQKVLAEIAGSAFTKKKLLADIDAIEKATKEALALEKTAVGKRKEKRDAFGDMVAGWFAPAEMRSYVERRADAVAKQVATMKMDAK
ncbi:MAG: CotH kinase family protein [Planctomycetes bacterium]|nr:CotH kinase family protein [Planctomycetota bacterium]